MVCIFLHAAGFVFFHVRVTQIFHNNSKNFLFFHDLGCPEATYTGEPLPGQSIRPTSSPPTTPPTATNGELFPWTSVRLPTHVRPLHYDLSLHPNLTSRYVKGEIQADIVVCLFLGQHSLALNKVGDLSFLSM